MFEQSRHCCWGEHGVSPAQNEKHYALGWPAKVHLLFQIWLMDIAHPTCRQGASRYPALEDTYICDFINCKFFIPACHWIVPRQQSCNEYYLEEHILEKYIFPIKSKIKIIQCIPRGLFVMSRLLLSWIIFTSVFLHWHIAKKIYHC